MNQAVCDREVTLAPIRPGLPKEVDMRLKGLFVLLLLLCLSSCAEPVLEETEAPTSTPKSTAAIPSRIAQASASPGPGANVPVWANDGGDKVTRDELRATVDPNAVLNAVWDGTSITLFGARNEVIAFNLVLEAPTTEATGVNLALSELVGPEGATITTQPASGDDLFNSLGRNIELFYVRYLEIKGISTDLFFAGYDYDERHIPERCRLPFDEEGSGSGLWEERWCHNKFYPDIAVPLELHSPFTIPAGSNQSIWGDITIPKTIPSGLYSGEIIITEDGAPPREIPIHLQVHDFQLPDLPNARTMLYYSLENIVDRYLGGGTITKSLGVPATTNL